MSIYRAGDLTSITTNAIITRIGLVIGAGMPVTAVARPAGWRPSHLNALPW